MEASSLENFPGISKTEQEVREQLMSNGYANLGFPLGKNACSELFESFKNFVHLCKDSDGKRFSDAVTFKVNDMGNGAYQLTHRQPGVHNPHEAHRAAGKDHKYIFHYGIRTKAQAEDSLGTLPWVMKDFLERCDEFYLAGREAARIGIKSLGIEPLLLPDDREQDVHHLRLIDYIAGDSQSLGEAHFDRGVTTLAISESSPGLRGAPADNDYLERSEPLVPDLESLEPVDHHERVAKFFAGAGLRRLPPAIRKINDLDHVPLFAHDIVNERPGENRQAVVMFFNPHLGFNDFIVPSKDETHVST